MFSICKPTTALLLEIEPSVVLLLYTICKAWSGLVVPIPTLLSKKPAPNELVEINEPLTILPAILRSSTLLTSK